MDSYRDQVLITQIEILLWYGILHQSCDTAKPDAMRRQVRFEGKWLAIFREASRNSPT